MKILLKTNALSKGYAKVNIPHRMAALVMENCDLISIQEECYISLVGGDRNE